MKNKIPIIKHAGKLRTLNPSPASTILFEGDSFTSFRSKPCLDTWPWQRLTGAHYGYPERVGDWIFCNRPDLNINCHNGAVGGSIVNDILIRFPTITEPLKPGIVIMTIGGSDSTRGTPLAVVRSEICEYCSRLLDLCGGKVLYLGNFLPLHDASEPMRQKREEARPYTQAIAEVVDAHGGLAVDLGTVLVRKHEALVKLWPGHSISHDGNHFNPVGYEIVTSVVLRALGLMQMPGDPCEPGPMELS
jgi:lysophospholipase L1-like esterase